MQLQVVFDHPDEYLVSIHGYYSSLRNWGFAGSVVRSLTLETNKKSYGPFGEEVGSKFSIPMGKNFCGLHGRAGSFLDSIGGYAISTQHPHPL